MKPDVSLADARQVRGLIDYQAADLVRLGENLGKARDVIDALTEDAYRKRDYVEHLEGRLATLRATPPTMLGLLAELERLGTKVLQIRHGGGGLVVEVTLHWPGDEHPTQHRRPDGLDMDDAAFVRSLREYFDDRTARHREPPP